jgi:hypothetical protein
MFHKIYEIHIFCFYSWQPCNFDYFLTLPNAWYFSTVLRILPCRLISDFCFSAIHLFPQRRINGKKFQTGSKTTDSHFTLGKTDLWYIQETNL